MSLAELISIVCAVTSVAVTVVIGCFQIMQNKNIRRFEERQDSRDEKRRDEELKAKVTMFMLEHHAELLLLPLSCIAAVYGDILHYHRALYRDFCCQTREVQNAILKAAGLDLTVFDESKLFNKCIERITVLQKERCRNLFDIFYDGGKYVKRALTVYGKESIPVHEIFYTSPCLHQSLVYDEKSVYEECLTDVLLELRGDRADFGDVDLSKVLDSVYHFQSVTEIEACEYACFAARYISSYFMVEQKRNDRNLGCMEDFNEAKLTMEDLFLMTLFDIWSNLLAEDATD